MATLTAFYDLKYGPVSYDFVTWLVRARFEANERKCHRLHVVIVPNETGLGGFSRHWGEHDEMATLWRLWHIVIAACPLAGATVTVADTRAQAESICDGLDSAFAWCPEGKAHFMGPLVQAARAGKAIPRLTATAQAKHYVEKSYAHLDRPLATLTLRRQNTDPTRNSKASEWFKVSDWLKSRGFDVLVLDDSNVALQNGTGFVELDPDLRLALYERAALNVIGNNGPQELLKFSAANYCIFGLALTDGWKDHWRKYFAMEHGEQVPWAGPKQRMVYREDKSEIMKEELLALIS